MDKFDFKQKDKEYFIRKLKCAEHFDPPISNYVCDKDIFRYKNLAKREWLNRGDIITSKGELYVYLGYTRPGGPYMERIRHHLMSKFGIRYLWKLPVDMPIIKVGIDDSEQRKQK